MFHYDEACFGNNLLQERLTKKMNGTVYFVKLFVCCFKAKAKSAVQHC